MSDLLKYYSVKNKFKDISRKVFDEEDISGVPWIRDESVQVFMDIFEKKMENAIRKAVLVAVEENKKIIEEKHILWSVLKLE